VQETRAEEDPGYFIATFGIDGEPVSTGYWSLAKLSAKWLKLCREYLDWHGTAFDEPWSGKLSHIRTKFSAASGVGLVTFSASGIPVVSIVLASGRSPAPETSVLKMFVESLRGVELVRAAAQSDQPFEQALAIKERPLMILVPWAFRETSEEDQALVRELSLHLAGAFFDRRSKS
jgi:hypothetical protein